MLSKQTKDKVRGFIQHGVQFLTAAGQQIRGICPFCHGSKKHPDTFMVHEDKLVWLCVRCNRKGNFQGFLTEMTTGYSTAFTGRPAKRLSKDRGISEEVLMSLGIGYDPTSKLYMIPFWDMKRDKVLQIQRYSMSKRSFRNTTGGKRGYIHTGDPDAGTASWVVEGPWDSGVITQALSETDTRDTVIGVCGALSGQGPELAKILKDRHVTLAFDHDKTGAQADQKSRELLKSVVRSLRTVHWPKGSKAGYDSRDLWNDTKHKPGRFLRDLGRLRQDAPRAQTKSRKVGASAPPQNNATSSGRKGPSTQAELTGKGLTKRRTVKQYRAHMHMPKSEPLDVLFGTAFANRLGGDPLWLFLVGPPGCGKTELIMSLTDAPFVFPLTTMTPATLVSGKDGAGGQDPSILPMLGGKLLALEDFTTVLSMPIIARDEIFGVLRAAYNGRFEKRYGNGIHRLYPNCHFGIIAGVTPKIEELGPGHSVVGERFLKYYMRDSCKINAGAQVVMRSIVSVNENKESYMRDELAKIGYEVLNRPVLDTERPRISKLALKRLHALAMWTANLRAAVPRDKYTHELVHKPVTEIGSRLGKQLTKLAMGIAIFHNKKVVGVDELQTVLKVAKDTVPDLVQDVVRSIYLRRHGKIAVSAEIAEWTAFPQATVTTVVQNLTMLGVLLREKKRAGEITYRINPVIISMMQPLGLYAKEKRWKRVKAKGGKRVK